MIRPVAIPRLCSICALASWLAVGLVSSPAAAQNPAHPDAKPPLPENPYLSYREPYRWDIRAQLFLQAGNVVAYYPGGHRDGIFDDVISTEWQVKDIELVYPVVREGAFYWSPNEDVQVDIRLDEADVFDLYGAEDPIDIDRAPIERKYIKGTFDAYTYWNSLGIRGDYRLLHLIHTSHIVAADTVFNERLARQLPWPDEWSPRAKAYLSPIVDSTGFPVPDDADETIETLLEFWTEENDPRSIPQLDLVKFLTGKVIDYFTVRGQSVEFTTRSTAAGRPSFVVASDALGGFLVRPAHVVAREPSGSKHDLATLLTAVLRSAGVPARTVICINEQIDDPLQNVVSMVEFAMHDPDRDLTFWVPIDVDRVRLNGARASQYKRPWLYFGSHDELNHYIPIAHYFHPPAEFKAFNLPLLYGIRRVGDDAPPLPGYMIQWLVIDPILSPARGGRPPNSNP